mgnify:CR=1 FL=1
MANGSSRPLSPHLQVYRFQWTMALSITHRITGVGLVIGTLLITWWLVAAAAGPEAFATAQGFIGSWFDPPKAKEAAFAMIERKADVLYAERFGVSDAAKERGVLAIGNVIDTQAQYPDTVVASALWHMEPTIDAAIAAVKAKSFKAEDYGHYSNMKPGGASLAPYGTFEDKIPAELKAKVEAKKAAILDGSFTVEVNDAEPKPTM